MIQWKCGNGNLKSKYFPTKNKWKNKTLKKRGNWNTRERGSGALTAISEQTSPKQPLCLTRVSILK